MKVDYSLYLVTDRKLSQGRDILEIIKMAIKGGVTIVQLREKDATTREFLSVGKRVKELLDKKNIPLIINDRIDIALALDADGVHLGNDDMPIEIARRILGKNKIIGLSAESIDDAIEADIKGADYIGVSPIYTTPTKPELEKGLGIEGLKKIRKVTSLPLVAIGGMKAKNCREAIKNGADGIAVVSAICSAPNPEIAAREIISEINKGRKNLNEFKRNR